MRKIFLIAILLCTSLLAQSADENQKIYNLYSDEKYHEGIDLVKQILIREKKNNVLMLYAADFYSLLNKKDSSFIWLRRAIENGYSDYNALRADQDLINIKAGGEFFNLVSKAKRNLIEENESKAIRLDESKWSKVKLQGDNSLPDISLSFSFDYKCLFINADIKDNHFYDGDRSWRYGDGFTMNFITPSEPDSGYSNKFYSYGFSFEKGMPTAVLINKDGEYFLKKVKEIQPLINIDTLNKTASYKIRIPWKYLYPYHPLLNNKFGINIIYISRESSGSRNIIKYVNDDYYDSETIKVKRYAPVYFNFTEGSKFQAVGTIENRLADKTSAVINIKCWAPNKDEFKYKLRVCESNDKIISNDDASYSINKGLNLLSNKINLPNKEGIFSVELISGDSVLWKDYIYKYDKEKLENEIKAVKAFNPGKDVLKKNSKYALTYLSGELITEIKDFDERSNLIGIKNSIESFSVFAEELIVKESIFIKEGYSLSAFKSSADNSLQPYSLILPIDFNPSKEYDLVFALHGSGVDEVNFVKSADDVFQGGNFIIAGIRGRNLSSWYLDKTEADAVDLIIELKKMFKINKTILYGFSMGGYGVWRMSLLHPEHFDIAICASGGIKPFIGGGDKFDVNKFIGKGKGISYLVLHGTADDAIKIDEVDKFIGRLKEDNYKVDYIRIEGAGHGNYKSKEIINKWMEGK